MLVSTSHTADVICVCTTSARVFLFFFEYASVAKVGCLAA